MTGDERGTATALVTRSPRRAVMVSADVLRAIIALALPSAGQLWQVYVLVGVCQAASAVWITHATDLPAARLMTSRSFAAKSAYLLVSPAGLPKPEVASAWGLQPRLVSAHDPRLAAFVAK